MKYHIWQYEVSQFNGEIGDVGYIEGIFNSYDEAADRVGHLRLTFDTRRPHDIAYYYVIAPSTFEIIAKQKMNATIALATQMEVFCLEMEVAATEEPEEGHIDADKRLVRAIIHLSRHEPALLDVARRLTDLYEQVHKWYS